MSSAVPVYYSERASSTKLCLAKTERHVAQVPSKIASAKRAGRRPTVFARAHDAGEACHTISSMILFH
jgi:hypothetical protein